MYLLQKNRIYSESIQQFVRKSTELYFRKTYKITYIMMKYKTRVTLIVCQGYFTLFVAQSYKNIQKLQREYDLHK